MSDDTTLEHIASDGPESALSLVFYGRRDTRVLRMHEGDAFVVGRAHPADVVIDDSSLSRKHASFRCEGDHVIVEDLDSTNGVRVYGKTVRDHRLRAGESVQLGGVSATLHSQVLGASVEGLETHATFMERVDEEVERARRFGRALSVVFVRALERDAHVRTFMPHIASMLPTGGRVSVYGPRSLLLLLAEHDAAAAKELANRWSNRLGDATLRTGVATFPAQGSNGAALLESARSASRGKSTSLANAEDDGVPVIADPAMERLYNTLERVAPSNLNVLVTGETGTGKELVARAIHTKSGARAAGAFQAVNCGALTDALLQSALFGHVEGAFTGAASDQRGLFEAASGGTLFLDEVGELSAAAQAALLRALETGRITRVGSTVEVPVDVRIVAATHRDLEGSASEGRFRSDLLYRLNGVSFELPPLRERKAEILPLAERFLAQAARERGEALRFSDEAKSLLEAHRWPGNVRELRNAVERAAVIAESTVVGAEDLPRGLGAKPPAGPSELGEGSFKERIQAYERQLILNALAESGGNQTEAARRLSMPLRTLVHKIARYGIKKRFDG